MSDSQILVAGETLVDMFPTTDRPLAEAETFERRAGGAPANVAVAMARLDRPATLWTRLGADPFGEYLATVLERNDVPSQFVERDAERKTALTLVGADSDGDQSFVFYEDGTATMALEPGTIDDATLADLAWVHLGGVLLAAEPGRSAMLDLVERASAAGCTVSFDPNTRLDLWPDPSELEPTLRDVLEHVDVVKSDREDLAVLLEGADASDVAERLTDLGPHTVFLTQGSAGSLGHATAGAPWGPGTVEQPSPDVEAVDTTGAGDAFTAGVITALVEGSSLGESVAFGNAVGALATTETGAMAALPDREQVASLRRE